MNGDEVGVGGTFTRALRSTNIVVRFSIRPERIDSVEGGGVGVALREIWNRRGSLTGRGLARLVFCGIVCRILWKTWQLAITQRDRRIKEGEAPIRA